MLPSTARWTRVSQQLTQRVKELAERYEVPLPQMLDRVAELEAKVNCHLKKDGVRMDVRPGYKQTEVGVIPRIGKSSKLGIARSHLRPGRSVVHCKIRLRL